jgi:uncharacterized protein involved in outer membrane biogenesis
MSESRPPSHTQTPPTPPPLEPDPELIDHLEGNRSSRQRYRNKAKEMRDEASPASRREPSK